MVSQFGLGISVETGLDISSFENGLSHWNRSFSN